MFRRVLSALAVGLYRLSALGLRKEFEFTRYRMYVRLREFGRTIPRRSGDVLAISHSTFLGEVLGLKDVKLTQANYPDYNILALPFPDASFDFVLSDQVFEHIEGDPQQATDECLRVLRPGGLMVHTTCFMIPYHGPGDYWRYTPEGLRFLCRKASRIHQAEGWGNTLVPLMTFLGFTRTPVPVARWHPLHWLAWWRRASYDHVVWVVAEK